MTIAANTGRYRNPTMQTRSCPLASAGAPESHRPPIARFGRLASAVLAVLVACSGFEEQTTPETQAAAVLPRPLKPDVLAVPTGTWSGALGVDRMGQAQYSLPLSLPPGRAGMQPSLGLSYSSGTGDGMLGVGWRFSAPAQISRCASEALVVPRRGVAHDSQDAFCLDGERLWPVTVANAPANELYFSPRFDPSVRVVARTNGLAAADPAWDVLSFEIRYPNGTRGLLGLGSDSVVTGFRGRRTQWLTNRVVDGQGNMIDFSYAKQQARPHWLIGTPDVGRQLRQISYGGNTRNTSSEADDLPHTRRVNLEYESAHGPTALLDTVAYSLGQSFWRTSRLNLITVSVDGQLVAKYKLGYALSDHTGRSLLSDVRRCTMVPGSPPVAASEACERPTTFDYSGGVGATGATRTIPSTVAPISDGLGPLLADMNGDGRSDLVYSERHDFIGSYGPHATQRIIYKPALPLGGAELFGDPVIAATYDAASVGGVVSDFDGDGVLDLALYEPDNPQRGWSVLHRSAAGNILSTATVVLGHSPQDRWVDLDADGRMDAVFCRHRPEDDLEANPPIVPRYWVSYQDSPSSFTPAVSLPIGCGPNLQPPVIGDFNGDRAMDLLQVSVARLEGTNDYRTMAALAGFANRQERIEVGTSGWLDTSYLGVDYSAASDVNGDGLDDLVWVSRSLDPGSPILEYRYRANTGDFGNFFAQFGETLTQRDSVLTIGDVGPAGTFQPTLVDLDGDSRADIVEFDAQNVYLAFNRGQSDLGPSFPTEVSFAIPADRGPSLFGDIDGNGMTDIVWPLASGGYFVFQNTTERPDMMVGVHEGDATVSSARIEYGQLSDPSVYMHSRTVGECEEGPETFCIRGSQASVVKRVELDAGPFNTATPHASTYRYVGGKRSRTGAWLGFQTQEVTDVGTGAIQSTSFDLVTTANGFRPTLGRIVRHESAVPQGGRWTVSSETYAYRVVPASTFTDAVYLWQKTSRTTEQAARGSCAGDECRALDSYSYTASQVDGWGFPTRATETISGLIERVTTTSYDHDVASWIIGRRTSSDVSESGDDLRVDQRHQSWTYYPGSPKIHTHTSRADDDPRKLVSSFEYDAVGNLSRVCARDVARGEERCNITEYDAQAMFATAVVNPLGHRTEVVVHPIHGQARRIIDPNGEFADLQFDTSGRVVESVGADGVAVAYAYRSATSADLPEAAEVVTVTRPGSPPHDTAYDRLGRVVSESWAAYDGANAHVVQYEYALRGRVERVRGPYYRGAGGLAPPPTVTYRDAFGRPESVTYPDGSEVRWSYGVGLGADDPQRATRGQRVTKTDQNGHQRVSYYDGAGRLERVVDGRGGDMEYRYAPFRFVRWMRDAAGQETSFDIDPYGIRRSLTDPIGGFQTFETDAFGQVRGSLSHDANESISYDYDRLGRLTQRVATDAAADSWESHWDYDLPSWCADLPCAASAHTLGRVVSTRHGNRSVPKAQRDSVRYEYDGAGRLRTETRTIDQVGYRHDFAYDAQGRLESTRYPLADDGWQLHVGYEYAQGRLERVYDRGSGVALWTLKETDSAARAQRVDYGNNLSSEWGYSRMGQVTYARTGVAGATPLYERVYHHDLKGNLIGRVDTRQSMSEHFVYDELDRLKSSCFVGGSVAPPLPAYPTEDALSRLAEAGGPRDPAPPMAGPGAPPPSPNADDIARWDAYSASPLSGTDAAAVARAVGMPMGPTAVLGADTEYRPCSTYDYDAVGNLTYRDGVGSYEYPATTGAGRSMPVPSKIVHPSGSTTLKYDEAGRTTRIAANEYRYDALGQMLAVTQAAGLQQLGKTIQTTFAYDASGVRTKKSSGIGSSVYAGSFERRVTVGGNAIAQAVAGKVRAAHVTLYAEGSPFAEVVHYVTGLDLSGTSSLAFGPGGLSLDGLGQVQSASLAQTTSIYYLHQDPQGTTELVTDAGKPGRVGGVVERRSYEAFGRLRSNDWATGVTPPAAGRRNVGFTGHTEDEETGLTSMGGRVYSPGTGRFMTPDPYVQAPTNSQSLNRYAYVWNNPLTNVDPSGFSTRTALDIPEGSYILVHRRPYIRMPVRPSDTDPTASLGAEYDPDDPDGDEPIEPVDPEEDKPTRAPTSADSAWAEGPRQENPGALVSLYNGYRDFINLANSQVESVAHAAGDAIQDITGSDLAPAVAASAVQLIGGIPIGIAGLGLLPETIINSVGEADQGLKEIAEGLEEENSPKAWLGAAKVAGSVAVWAGTAAVATVGVKAIKRSAAKGAGEATGTALPDSYWIEKRAPEQVTPGTRTVNIDKPSSSGGSYHSTTHYDAAGRQVGQTHRTSHGRPHDHPSPHHHRRDPRTGERLKNPETGSVTWPGLFGN